MPAEALDDDYEPPKYYGPGRRQPAKGPVFEAYADARMDISCPDCAAPANSFCHTPTECSG